VATQAVDVPRGTLEPDVGRTSGTAADNLKGIPRYLVDTLNPTKLPQVLDKVVNGSVSRTCAYGLQRISENQLVGSTWTPSFYGYDGHGNVRFLENTAGTHGHTSMTPSTCASPAPEQPQTIISTAASRASFFPVL